MKQVVPKVSPMHWKLLAKAYISTSRILLEELLDQNRRTSFPACYQKSFLYGKGENGLSIRKMLLVPALYCLKHAIEVGLKYKEVMSVKKYNKTHNLNEVVTQKLPQNIEKLIKKYCDNEYFITSANSLGWDVSDPNNTLFRYPESDERLCHLYYLLGDIQAEEIIRNFITDCDIFTTFISSWE